MTDAILLKLAAVIGREEELRTNLGEDEYRGEWYAGLEVLMIDE